MLINIAISWLIHVMLPKNIFFFFFFKPWSTLRMTNIVVITGHFDKVDSNAMLDVTKQFISLNDKRKICITWHLFTNIFFLVSKSQNMLFASIKQFVYAMSRLCMDSYETSVHNVCKNETYSFSSHNCRGKIIVSIIDTSFVWLIIKLCRLPRSNPCCFR